MNMNPDEGSQRTREHRTVLVPPDSAFTDSVYGDFVDVNLKMYL